MNLIKAIQLYAVFQEARGDTKTHREDCARVLRVLASNVGELNVTEILAEDLREFLISVRKRPGLKGRKEVSDFTVFAYHRVLNAFFRYLAAEELIARNPMRQVPKPKIGQYLIRPFSDEQIKKLMQQPDTGTFTGLRDAALMCFLLDTGLRISEALSLTFDNLDQERRLVTVLGKGGKERQVPFGSVSQVWLEKYLERRESVDNELVFVNQYGERLTPNAMTHRIAQYGRRAGLRGIRVSPHTFRHTFSMNWLVGSGDYKGDTLSLQRILGHSTPTMTQRYVHLASQDLRKLHDRLSPANQVIAPPPSTGRRRLR